MMPLEMDVYMDHVEIEHTVVLRPEAVSRSVWMRFWELIKGKHYCPWCGRLHELG